MTAQESTDSQWRELRASLHRFVSRRVRDHADVEDIVQRVFLQMHRSLPTLRNADGLHAWLYRTARHAIADHYRAPVHRREVLVGSAGDVPELAPADGRGGESGEDEPARRELAACLRPLLGTLGDADRQALELIEVDGVSQVDAARRLGLSVSGMKSRVQRARTRLRGVVEACCRVELDRRGGLVHYQPRQEHGCGGCSDCGETAES